MNRLLAVLLIMLLCQTAGTAAVAAEKQSGLLTDAQVRHAIPLLKIYIKDSSEVMENGKNVLDEIRQDAELRAIRSEKTTMVDPLADISAHGGKPPLPGGATYQSACSRAITASRGGSIPVAVFSFGKSIDCMTKKQLAAANIEQRIISEGDSKPGCNKEFEQAKKLLTSITAFYEEKQYPGQDVRSSHGGTIDVLVDFTFPEHPSVDHLERGVKECAPVPNGVTMFISQNPFAGANEAADAAVDRSMNRRTVRLSDEQIDETLRVTALLKTARDQSAVPVDPEMQRQRDGLPPELAVLFKEAANNGNVYIKYKLEIDPLLDEMERLKR